MRLELGGLGNRGQSNSEQITSLRMAATRSQSALVSRTERRVSLAIGERYG